MTRLELQLALQKPYLQADWLRLLRAVLPGTEVFATPQKISSDNMHAESIAQLGKIQLAGDRRLALLEATVNGRVDLLRNRVGLRQLVARYIDQVRIPWRARHLSSAARQKTSVLPSPPATPPSTKRASLSGTKLRRAATPTCSVQMNPAAPPQSALVCSPIVDTTPS